MDIYCTKEPQMAFHQRISFCLDLHNQSVKAMRSLQPIYICESCFLLIIFLDIRLKLTARNWKVRRKEGKEKRRTLNWLRKWPKKTMMVSPKRFF